MVTESPQSNSVTEMIDKVLDRRELYAKDPYSLYPWLLAPCTVKVLLVSDGFIDFADGDFGLSTFVDSLINPGLWYVRYQITIAHLSESVSDAAVKLGEPGIHASIKGFVFDNPAHFTPTKYDQVWMFAAATNYHNGFYSTRNNNQATYPAGRLGNQELINLSAHSNNGRGIFATGDHGALGKAMAAEVTRVRSMRFWDSTSTDPFLDEVSMFGPRRNDTNDIGHNNLTEFDDQSDDIPQRIEPKLYRLNLTPYLTRTHPHPLLCGPRGIITVLPDHPHEGECITPNSLTDIYSYDSTEEYPVETGGSTRISPELIAISRVPAGNTAGGKIPTHPQCFGAICAYDGHRAGVGRVVTDATWHHFVNINLIGAEGYPPSNPKSLGFLASTSGKRHLQNILAYYRNIALWLSRPANFACFRRRICWRLLWQDRVIEAVTVHPDITMATAAPSTVYEIGFHAYEVLCKVMPRCFAYRLILSLVEVATPGMARQLDPWIEQTVPNGLGSWVDPTPTMYYALGGAMVRLRQQYAFPSADNATALDQSSVDYIEVGAAQGVEMALSSFSNDLEAFTTIAGDASNEVADRK